MPFTGETKRNYNKEYRTRQKMSKKMGVKATPKMDGDQALVDFERCRQLDIERKRAKGEFHTYEELCQIFYGSCVITPAIHEFFGKKITLDEWIDYRYKGRINLWFLAECCGYDGLNEKAHQPIIDFFTVKDNTSLPISYSNEQFKQCLLKQDTFHDRLLLYPRGFFKSTLTIVEGISFVLNFPDIVVLSVSSTIKLSNTFIKEVRDIFSVKDPDDPTFSCKSGLIKLLYPDFCIAHGSGEKSSYTCPMARLDMRNPTWSASSVESSTAGHRAHLVIFDDAQDEHNHNTVEQRLKVRNMYDAVRELVIRPYGFVIVDGTRWTNGKVGDDFVNGKQVAIPDLYGTIIERNEKFLNESLKILVSPAWTVLSSGYGKNVHDLEEQDVDLLFPGPQGSFKELKKKLEENEELFRCNQLNEPVSGLTENVFVNPFTEAKIDKCRIDSSFVLPKLNTGKIFTIWDTANSDRKTSDFSVGCSFFIEEISDADPIAYLLEAHIGHWTNSELAEEIVKFHSKWNPQSVLIEKIASQTDLFRKAIYSEQIKRQTGKFDPIWFDPDSQPKAKESRIVAIEPLMVSGRLRFCQGPRTNAILWYDELKKQFLGYQGHKTHKGHVGGRHDDLPDCIGYLYKLMPVGNSSPADKEARDLLKQQAEMRKRYNIIFTGGTSETVSLGSQWVNGGLASTPQFVPESEEENIRGSFGIPFAPKYKV